MRWRLSGPIRANRITTGERRVFLSPFGLYTRYTLVAYIRHTSLVAVGLLIVALTIDLSPQLQKIWSGHDGEAKGAEAVIRYLVLRSADVATRLIPIACFFGVLTAEIASTLSRERQVIWNTGRSPMQCLLPALLLGLLAGAIEFGFDGYVRPAAIAAQISSRLGEYGERYDRSLSNNRIWFVAGDDLIHARIEYEPPAALHDVTIYKFDGEQHRLESVIVADAAWPMTAGQSWRLERGRSWDTKASPNRQGADQNLGKSLETATLRLDPLWVSNMGINAMFLSQGVLEALSGSSGAFDKNAYRTWIQVRYASILLPSAMSALAASMSLLLLTTIVSPQALLGITLAGYAGHISTRAFSLLGAYGYLPPVVAGWFTPILQLTSAILLLAAASWWRSRLPGRAWAT